MLTRQILTIYLCPFILLSMFLLYYLYTSLDLRPFSDLVSDQFNKWQAEQLIRKSTVKKVCAKHGNLPSVGINRVVWSAAEEYGLFMCMNRKVGTSTYMGSTFTQIDEGNITNRDLLEKRFRLNNDNMKHLGNKSSISFVVIFPIKLNTFHLVINISFFILSTSFLLLFFR